MRITGCDRLTDVYRIMKGALKEGPVLVCYLDGFGYYGYEEACRKGRIPYIREHFLVCEMETVSPALTNPAMATMLTGVLPEAHGVLSRKEHRTKVPTIFAELSCPAAVVESDSIIVQTEIRQRLHPAMPGQSADRAVYEGAVRAAKELGHQGLLFVHFHGIDDAGHSFGPYAQETMDACEEADGYVRRLCEAWPGTCFLVSDHGQHEVEREAQADCGGRNETQAGCGGRNEVYNAGTDAAGKAGDHGTDAKEDRTAVFGWKYPTDRAEGADLLAMLCLEREPRQAIFYGRDGFASACTIEELKEKGRIRLLRQEGTAGLITWRMAAESEPVARRWCKDVTEIEMRWDG